MAIPIRAPRDLDELADVGQRADAVLATLVRRLRPGLTGVELHHAASSELAAHRLEPAPGSALCVNINHAAANAPPTDKQLVDGDVVTLDLCVRSQPTVERGSGASWCADVATSTIVGAPSPERRRLVDAAQACIRAALSEMGPARRWSLVAARVRAQARQSSLQLVRGLAGHGIGLLPHEPPVAWFTHADDTPDFELWPGMVLTIEPVLTTGTGQTVPGPGGAVCTADGAPAAGWETMVAVTGSGVRVLAGGVDPA